MASNRRSGSGLRLLTLARFSIAWHREIVKPGCQSLDWVIRPSFRQPKNPHRLVGVSNQSGRFCFGPRSRSILFAGSRPSQKSKSNEGQQRSTGENQTAPGITSSADPARPVRLRATGNDCPEPASHVGFSSPRMRLEQCDQLNRSPPGVAPWPVRSNHSLAIGLAACEPTP